MAPRGAAIFLLFLTIWGCYDDPSPVGIGILPPNDFLRIDTLVIYAAGSETYAQPLATGNSRTMLVGENNDFVSYGILRPDSYFIDVRLHPDTIRDTEFFEATLFLTPEYYQGDSAGTISLEAYAVETAWVTLDFNSQVFETLRFGSEKLSEASTLLGDTNAIAFPLSKELILEWSILSDQSILPNGLMLRSVHPTEGVIGFSMPSGAVYPPRLEIRMGNADAPDTLNLLDFRRAYAGYVKNPLSGADRLILQGGVATRNLLHFDMSLLPHGSVIHTATLQLTRNHDESITNSFSSDSVSVFPVTDANKLDFNSSFVGLFDDIDTSDGRRTVYRSRVSRIIQYLVTEGENKGLLLMDLNAFLGFHRTVFYPPSHPNEELRPKLTIVYSPI